MLVLLCILCSVYQFTIAEKEHEVLQGLFQSQSDVVCRLLLSWLLSSVSSAQLDLGPQLIEDVLGFVQRKVIWLDITQYYFYIRLVLFRTPVAIKIVDNS